MKLPPDVQFHKNARLLVYRPRGLLNESAINKVLSALEDLEAELQEPFDFPIRWQLTKLNLISNMSFSFLCIGASLMRDAHR